MCSIISLRIQTTHEPRELENLAEINSQLVGDTYLESLLNFKKQNVCFPMDLFTFCHFKQKYIHKVGKKLSLRREQQFALVVHYKRLQGVVHI